MRTKSIAALVGGGLLATASGAWAGNGTPIDADSSNVLTLAVYGDSPYGTTPTDTAEFDASPAFIDSINRDPKVDLVLHVGDIHSGKQFCTSAYDSDIYDLFQQFKDPLVYTPGDNEWTDCHRAAEGAKAPLQELTNLRGLFFSHPGETLGGRKMQVLTQAEEFDPNFPSDAQYVENVMWEESRVVFVTLNLPGSNNDTVPWTGVQANPSAQATEVQQRTDANMRWLGRAFAQAFLDDAR